jgi:hypothetical protein
MKSIKQILFGAVLVSVAFCAVLYSSCSKSSNSSPVNPCNSISCQNGGTCDSATASCSCAIGYEGLRCDTLSRTRFIRSWSASDLITGGSTPLSYTANIAAGVSSDVTQVIIGAAFSDNFFVNSINAIVSGTTITIPLQNPDVNKYTVSGTGTFANNKITWSYTIKNDSTSVTQVYSGTWQ